MAPSVPTRRPYHGSCHCGHTRYIAFLTLPPPVIEASAAAHTTVRLRRCACASCHKMGFFHTRLMDSPGDFVLLSPVAGKEGDEEGRTGYAGVVGLSDYTCYEGDIHWLFCPKCGVRCFSVCGDGETVKIDLDAWKEGKSVEEVDKGASGKELTRVWRLKRGGWNEGGVDEDGQTTYFSVNAMTLEPGQEGLDLREWTEKKWVCYLTFGSEDRYERPHKGGAY